MKIDPTKFMKVGVASENEIKLNAVRNVYVSLGLPAIISEYKTDSCVGEQPVSEETYRGAMNRLLDVFLKNKNLDRIISIENGIFYEPIEGELNWGDKAVIILCKVGDPIEVYLGYTSPVIFPNKYVEDARQMGFEHVTVGGVMKGDGFVEDAQDPHKSLTGKSRQTYIEEALTEIVKRAEGIN